MSAIRLPLGMQALLMRQLSDLLSAGVPLDQALEILGTLSHRRAVPLVTGLTRQIRSGQPLSAGFAAAGSPFGEVGVALARAGEAGGSLGRNLAQLAGLLERRDDFRRALRQALTYPCLLLLLALASVVLLAGFVLPRFETLLRDLGGNLPWSTRLLLGLSDLFARGWPFLLTGFVLIVLGLAWWSQQPDGRIAIDRALLRLPVIGPLTVKAAVERFARVLAALLAGGVALPAALALARAAIGNRAIEAALSQIDIAVRAGGGLAQALGATGMFPLAATALISIGEETGRLELMLDRLAELYARDVATGLQTLVTLLTPAMTLLLGAVVAGVILSLLVPLMGLYDLAL